MFIQSRNIKIKKAIVDAMLEALSARPAAALLVTPFVHLYTASTANPSPNSVPGDFTEATFVGYAPVALALPLGGPLTLNASYEGVTNQANFIAGAVVTPGENILGYWIDDNATTPTVLYAAEAFSSQIPITNPGDFISLDVIFGAITQPSLS